MASKAKPMRVWLVFNRASIRVCVCMSAKYAAERLAYWNECGVSAPYRVVEFVSVTPRKRQKGKSK